MICCICMLSVSMLLLVLILAYRRHNRNIEDITRYSINVQSSISIEVRSILEDIFNDCYEDYYIMEMIKYNHAYITTEMEEKIIKDLSK